MSAAADNGSVAYINFAMVEYYAPTPTSVEYRIYDAASEYMFPVDLVLEYDVHKNGTLIRKVEWVLKAGTTTFEEFVCSDGEYVGDIRVKSQVGISNKIMFKPQNKIYAEGNYVCSTYPVEQRIIVYCILHNIDGNVVSNNRTVILDAGQTKSVEASLGNNYYKVNKLSGYANTNLKYVYTIGE